KLLSTKVENLKPDTSYTIQVKQVSGEEESDFSDSVTFKTNVQK
ncbi:fibronectin type III domain-containing protein, partial [Lactococcus petauri]